MKLTAAIAMSYPNAHVTTKYDEGKSYKVVGVSEWEGNLQVQTSENETDWWNIDQCQLILTPLDKISDEDAVEVAKITSEEKEENYTSTYVKEDCRLTIWKSYSLRVFDYLRSKGYDLGHGVAGEKETK